MICDKCIKKSVCKIRDAIEAVSCIEFVGVKRSDVYRSGYWTKDSRPNAFGWYRCSECGDISDRRTPFCSKCGAEMRKDEE